jgi:hypothetical protein
VTPGGAVELGGYSLEVSAPRIAATSEAQPMNFPRVKPGQHFEKLTVTVRNTTSDPKPWSLLALKMHDTNGQSMDYSIQPTDLVSLTSLAPQEARSATAYVLLLAGQVLGSVSLVTWRIDQIGQYRAMELADWNREQLKATARIDLSDGPGSINS